jgi:hypothetical protein
MNKEFNKTVKFFKKNKKEIFKAIIPVVIFCLLLTIIGIIIPKPNDNISPSSKYLFENKNPTFSVSFGKQDNPAEQYVRFESGTDDNPFEDKEKGFWDSVTQFFSKKQGIEFALSEVNYGETDSEFSKQLIENLGNAIDQMEVDSISTNTEVIEVGRLLGEDSEDLSKETVINKDVYPGIDIEYQILEGLGVKEEIVIRNIDEYTSNCGNDTECLLPLNEFVFDLKLDEGLKLKQSMAMVRGKVENTYYITDKDNNYFAHFLPTFAVDEADSKTSMVDFDISQVDEDNYKMSITLDPDWLFSDNRVFPIRIDPSIVHDTTTEFDTGTDYNTEVVTGPKVQLKDPEAYYADSNVVGYWRMDDNVGSIVPDDPDLEGYWNLQETSGTLYDKSVNGNHGTATGTTSTGGKILNGRSFNGTSDYISVPTDASLNITGDLTVETWIHPDDSLGTASANRWLEKGDSYFLMEGNGGVTGTGITFLVKYNGTNYYVDSGTTHPAGQWYHVVGVHDDSANLLRLYINGTQVNTTAFTGSIDNDNLALRIGSDDSGIYFDGLIDEVGIYSTALSATEIEDRYELGRNILDSSGNDDHGLTLGTNYIKDGVLGGARDFDGSSDQIEIASNLGVGTSNITLEAWVKVDSTSENGLVVKVGGTTDGYGFGVGNGDFDTAGNNLVLLYEYVRWIDTGYALDLGWNHIAMVVNSSQKPSAYVNGMLVYSDTGSNPLSPSNSTWIGGYNNRYLDATIDEVLISNVARSADEIQRSYQISFEKLIQGAHTSAELDFGSTADVDAITWTPVGDNTGDGETPYSTTGLVGQWNFNESSGTTADNEGSCGSSCDGTLTNFSDTSGQDVAGDSGWTNDNRRWGDGALMFDGSNDYVSTGTSSLFATTTYTISGWFKAEDSSEYRVITSRNTASDNRSWWIAIWKNGDGAFDGGSLVWRASIGGSWTNGVNLSSSINVADGKWHHFATVLNGSTEAILYLDGEVVATQGLSGTIDTPSTAMIIGNDPSEPGRNFNGVLDSMTYYSRALSSTEILSNYQSGNIEMRYRTSSDGSTWSSWKGGIESSVEGFDDDEYLYDQYESDLVGYWPMDEASGSTVTDVTTNSNDGVSNGSSIIGGEYRNARYFDGSNDYIEIPNDTNLQLTTTFSYSAWIYRGSDTGGWERLMSKSDTSGVDYYMQIASDDKLHCGLNTSGATNNSRRSATSIPVGKWTYVACTMDSSLNWHVYINGFLDDGLQEGSRVSANVSTRNLQFGRLGSSSTWYYTFNGRIDEFQLYDIELSSAQVYQHWLKRSSDYVSDYYGALDKDVQAVSVDGNNSLEIKSDGIIVDGNTVGYWKMDENIESIVSTDTNLEGYWDLVESSGTGAYIEDKSSNSNDGTPTGTTYIDGKINGGRSFNGSTDYITVPNDSSLAFERTDEFSIEAWFKTTNTDLVDIVSKMDNSSPYRGYDINLYNSAVWFQIVGTWDTSTLAIYTNNTFADGSWHHVVATYDGSSSASGAKIYVDGVAQTTTTYLNNLSSTIVETTPLTIGDRYGASGAEFNGSIDEVGIYSKELSSVEALARYEAGLDIKDSSGNNFHGSSAYLNYNEGIYNGGRDLDGSTDFIEINDSFSGINTLTVSLWIKTTSSSRGSIVGFADVRVPNSPSSWLPILLLQSDGKIRAEYWTGSTNAIISSTVVNDGSWHFISFVGLGSSQELYIDGQLEGARSGTINNSWWTNTTIGVGYDTTARGASVNGWDYFDGLVDEVNISNIARTGPEINNYYDFAKGEYLVKTIGTNNVSSNTLLPFWFASDSLGSNAEILYSESDYAGLLPDEDTVGYWSFDTYRNQDISGNGNDGRDAYNGIEYGMRDWNVSVIMNQWNGAGNSGEIDLTCPDGDSSCYLITMDGAVLSTPSINYGIAMQDGGSGNAYIMYSPSLSGQGITPYSNGSNNYISVRWTGSVWQYDNNSSWITFTPNSSNILVAYLTLFSSASGLTIHPIPTEGVYGEGRDFDGSKDYISIPSGIDISNSSFSVDMWAKSSSSGSYEFLLGQGSASNNQGLHIGFRDSGVFTFAFYNDDLDTSTVYVDDEWHYWVCSYDASTNARKIYRDGLLVASDTASADYQGTGELTIGARLFGVAYYFDGLIDEVRISDVARSIDEIRQSYEAGRRIHPIKVNFKADLESSNLISGVSDTSFTINEQNYGTDDYIENIDIGEKIVIKESYQGIEYIAQGDIATRNTSTGAVTVSSWDSSSSFPAQGFTTAATVFKWQREYIDIRYPLNEDINEISKLTFKKTTDAPAVFYIDDLKKATYSSDYDASEFGALGASTSVETAIDSFDQDYLYDTTASNLTAYYPMDETSGSTVDNVISSSYDGTASGTNIIDGRFGEARRFDGSDDYVNIGSSLHPSLPVSISAWIYIENIGVGMGVFNNDKLYMSTHNQSGIFINISVDGKLLVSYGDNTACSTTSSRTAETTESLQTGKWYHMVGILRGSENIDIYLDGIKQPVNYTGTGGSLVYAGHNGGIGAVVDCSTGSVAPLDGSIDELRVYTRSITASEVWNLYKAGSTSPRSVRTTSISSYVEEGTGAWAFDSDVYTTDPATVGLWHLDESSGSGAYLLDSSYNSYDGTPTGTTFVSAGKFNGARSFDGTGSDYIATSLDTEADSLYADTGYTWTVEAWFKHNGGLTEDGVIIGRAAGTGTSAHFGLFVDTSGNLRTVIRGAYTTIASGVGDNSWHHVTVTWNGSIGRGYFDGEFQTELTIGTAGAQSYNVYIGAQANGTNFFYEGQIDEVRIANVALGADEIESAYNLGQGNYITKTFNTSDLSDHATLPFWIASDNLGNNYDVIYGEDNYALYEPDVYTEGLWHLDESSGSGAYLVDSSSNGNNATPSGTSYATGRHDGARSFNGTSDYVNAGSSNTLKPTTELTVSTWVYADSGPASEGRTAVSTFNYVSQTESYGWNLGAIWTGDKFQFVVCDGGTIADHTVEDETFFTKYLGEWVHVTGVFKSSEYIRLYENGELVAETTSGVPSSIVYSSNDLIIGRRSSQSQSEWDGMIDEVRISSKALSTVEIQAEYNRGDYTHDITVDFKADLQSANLISNSSDISFTISEQAYGATDPIENLSIGDKIIVKEVVSGTEYIAQGDVDTLTASTGAVTVDAWDSGSTFPGSGFTTSATVFKWQMEEINISDFLTGGEVYLDDIAFKKVSDVEGLLWVDDLTKATAAYNPDTTYLEGVQYVQYEAIFTKWDDNPYLDLYLSEFTVDYSSGPTMDQLMRHGKWFNSSGVEQPFWWVNN